MRPMAFILLMVMLANTAWYYPVTQYHRVQIRREIKRRIKNSIPEDQLHTITVRSETDPSLKWIHKGKEFRFRGMMYDVVRLQKTDSSITYHCINDMEETLLFAELDQKVQQQMDHQDNGGSGILAKKILKAITANLYLNPNYPSINQPVYSLIHQSGYTDYLTAPAREILTPPPQV